MTKKEIVKDISDKLDLTQLKTKEIVQMTFDAIIETLVNSGDHRIELRNFGVFAVKRRKARKARNPRTGERVDVPPKNVVTFKPGKRMEELVSKITDAPMLEEDDLHDDSSENSSNSQDIADVVATRAAALSSSANGAPGSYP